MNGGRDPLIDYLGFHWYDYGMSIQLDRLTKYRKQFWVTEFANWHDLHDGADIDTLTKQEEQMRVGVKLGWNRFQDMVVTCDGHRDVFRYAWFTGRWDPDTHYTSVLGADGVLTDLGYIYTII